MVGRCRADEQQPDKGSGDQKREHQPSPRWNWASSATVLAGRFKVCDVISNPTAYHPPPPLTTASWGIRGSDGKKGAARLCARPYAQRGDSTIII